jgi:hypothetical protein
MATKTKPLFTESTDVPVQKSVGEITSMLITAGARSISTNYNSGKIESLSFVMPFGSGQIPYLLPVRIEPVFQKLNGRREKWGQFSRSAMAAKDREQAERVAWRQLYWWLKAQLAMIDLGMAEAGEILMPYMLGPDGRSFFDTYKPRMLAAPKDGDA